MTTTLRIQPIDVIYLRGNRLFGTAGDYAEAVMPPWPSVFSGAIRSKILVDKAINMAAFLKGEVENDKVKKVIGTPSAPGTFRIGTIGITTGDEVYFPAPKDLFLSSEEGTDRFILHIVEIGKYRGIKSNYPLPLIPIVRSSHPTKEETVWISSTGLQKHLAGEPVDKKYFLRQKDIQQKLWDYDSRLGIALDSSKRSVEKGKIYTSEAVALHNNVAFLVEVEGADDLLPKNGVIRFGGDGRGAIIAQDKNDPIVQPIPIQSDMKRFRVILSSPGIFPKGPDGEAWLPPGITKERGDFFLEYKGLKAKLIAAVIPRLQIVSGWDIAEQRPKDAVRSVPSGSVYWFEIIKGSAEALVDIQQHGLWPLFKAYATESSWLQRKAEGYNNVWIGV